MKDLNQALREITAIREQIARTSEFRGYGPLTMAATGLLAIAAAVFQDRALAGAAIGIASFLELWVSVAVLATALIAIEMVARSRAIHSSLAPEMIAAAVESLVPSGVSGILLTAVVVTKAPDAAWMLPGLWQLLLGLGVCASARFLPRATLVVACWYVVCGLASIAWMAGTRELSPWVMGASFGAGQLLAAIILQRSQSTVDESQDE